MTAVEAAFPETRYRTRNRAEDSGPLAAVPERLAIPIRRPYLNAFAEVDDPAAHLIYDTAPGMDVVMLRLLYGVALYDIMSKTVDSQFMSAETMLRNLSDPEYGNRTIKLYIPDLHRATAHKNESGYVTDSIAAKINCLRNLECVIDGERQPVMESIGYDPMDNTISFRSPYFARIITAILKSGIKTDAAGKPVTDEYGEPILLPGHSFLVRPGILKEQNKRAAEIACNVVALIEQTNRKTVGIPAARLVERYPDLIAAIDSASDVRRKNTILGRAFSKAWELLDTQTDLGSAYRNLRLPDAIPSTRQLGRELVFSHDGKDKGYIEGFKAADAF